ncbi:hypothetical protein R3P38DRAFT_3187517 [Favolaschia claudopus]|uniref:F-box domain-containing protein n=1 Tax=Favolaschia claudopus TaxID=2862362 RepID=A0AAW0C1E6_9AGAR
MSSSPTPDSPDTAELRNNLPLRISMAPWECSPRLCYAYQIALDRFNPLTSTMPINGLPVELLEKIFLLVPDPPDRYPERWNKSRAMLSLICRVWEGIVWHCPEFSAVICVDIRVDLSLLARRLNFAGACPLALSFVFPSSGIWLCQPFPRLMELVFEMLAPHLDRCGSISLLLRNRHAGRLILDRITRLAARRLHSVRLLSWRGIYGLDEFHDPPDWEEAPIRPLFTHPMPVLTKLSLSGVLPPWPSVDSLSSLQILCLEDMHDYDGLPLGDFLSALRVMSVLRDLRLVNLLFSDLDTYAGPIIRVPSLRRLDFRCDEAEGSCFMAWLDLPSLHTVRITSDAEGGVNGMVRHIPLAVASRVRHLVLRTYFADLGCLRDCLQVFRSAEKIDARYNGSEFPLLLHAFSVHWPGNFSGLQDLWVDEALMDVVVGQLLNALVSSASLVPLRIVSRRRSTDERYDGAECVAHHLDLDKGNLVQSTKVWPCDIFGSEME